MRKRNIEVVVISNVHLGSEDCHADELLSYLNSIKPKHLILNGDFVDIHSISKGNLPSMHLRVLKKLIGLMSTGTEVSYTTGQNDLFFRKFAPFTLGKFRLRGHVTLNLDGKNAWFLNRDLLDISPVIIRWLTGSGSLGFGFLLKLNVFYSGIHRYFRRGVENRRKVLREDTARLLQIEKALAGLAIEQGVDYIICGHLREPKKERQETQHGSCTLLSAGDWIKSLTALEYSFKRWKIYYYSDDKLPAFYADEDLKEMDMNELMAILVDNRIDGRSQKKEGSSGL